MSGTSIFVFKIELSNDTFFYTTYRVSQENVPVFERPQLFLKL